MLVPKVSRVVEEKWPRAITACSPHLFCLRARRDPLQVPGIPALHGAHSPRHQAAAALQFILQAQHAVAHAEGAADLQHGIDLTHRLTHVTVPRRGRAAALGKAFGRPRLQPFVHDEELVIFIEIGLRRCRDRAPIESGNHFCDFLDAKSDQPIAQVAERFAPDCIGKFTSLKNRPGIDSRIHVMDGDADWNMVQQRPLRTAHAANFRQQAQVHVEDAETGYIQQLLSQDVAARENDQVGRPLFETRNRIRRILVMCRSQPGSHRTQPLRAGCGRLHLSCLSKGWR